MPLPFHLTASALEDSLGRIDLHRLAACGEADCTPVPTGLSPLEIAWWKCALRDIEHHVVSGRYFGAGLEFGPTVFTRDVA